jgi:hypothetical protein
MPKKTDADPQRGLLLAVGTESAILGQGLGKAIRAHGMESYVFRRTSLMKQALQTTDSGYRER